MHFKYPYILCQSLLYYILPAHSLFVFLDRYERGNVCKNMKEGLIERGEYVAVLV